MFYSIAISYSVKRNFKRCGNDFFIDAPFTIVGYKYIEIGNGSHFQSNIRLDAIDQYRGSKYNPKIKIGNNVTINNYCHIGSIGEIIIEDNVLIASKVFITDHFHGDTSKDIIDTPPIKRELFMKGNVHIKQNVWIGENVAIMPNVTIGENCIIGANSVVTKNIPENCVVGGNPAKILRYLGAVAVVS